MSNNTAVKKPPLKMTKEEMREAIRQRINKMMDRHDKILRELSKR